MGERGGDNERDRKSKIQRLKVKEGERNDSGKRESRERRESERVRDSGRERGR